MDLDRIKSLLQLVERSKIDHFKFKNEEFCLELSKNMLKKASFSPQNTFTEKQEQTNPISQSIESGYLKILSPMNASFYLSPKPGEPDFCYVGKKMKKGDVLCLLEVMKMFNPVEAEQDCEIVKIHPENGSLIEEGAVLFEYRLL